MDRPENRHYSDKGSHYERGRADKDARALAKFLRRVDPRNVVAIPDAYAMRRIAVHGAVLNYD